MIWRHFRGFNIELTQLNSLAIPLRLNGGASTEYAKQEPALNLFIKDRTLPSSPFSRSFPERRADYPEPGQLPNEIKILIQERESECVIRASCKVDGSDSTAPLPPSFTLHRSFKLFRLHPRIFRYPTY